MNQIVNLTESARVHIRNVLINMNKPYLVFGLKGGGCAGFEYFWEPSDQEMYDQLGSPELDEFLDLGEDKTLVLDHHSLVYVAGCTIDYKTDFISSQLSVTNPNAKNSCGCGTSVSV
jgi:iron-sulfur cluster assembly accessory protein